MARYALRNQDKIRKALGDDLLNSLIASLLGQIIVFYYLQFQCRSYLTQPHTQLFL